MLPDEGRHGVAAGEDALHLPRQLRAHLQHHVVGQHVLHRLVLRPRQLVPPAEQLLGGDNNILLRKMSVGSEPTFKQNSCLLLSVVLAFLTISRWESGWSAGL